MAADHHAETATIGFFRSLRGRLLGLFLLIAGVPLLLLGLISASQFYDNMAQQIKYTFNSTADAQVYAIESWLAERLQDVILMAEQPAVQSMDQQNIAETVQGYFDVWGIYQNLFVLTPDGNRLFDTSGATSNLADRSYFQAALQGETVASDILFSRVSGLPIIVFAAPIRGESGAIVGVAGAVIQATHITDLVAQAWQGETGDAYLINQAGFFITDSRFTEELRAAEVVEESTARELQIDTEATRVVLAGQNGLLENYENFRGYDMLAAYRYIPAQGWGLIIEQENTEAFVAARQLQTTILVIIGSTILIVGFIALLAARWFTHPIQRLHQVAREITGGNLNARFTTSGQAELAELGAAFNEMTERLSNLLHAEQQRKQDLQAMVARYMDFVQQVADGDLRTRITLNGEAAADENLTRLGEQLNKMVDSLAVMTQQIRETADSVSSAAAEILAATTQQIASSTEQDSSVTQTMASVEEIINTVRQTADRAESVADASQQSVQVSQAGQAAVVASVDGMRTVRERVEDIAETILALSARTQQISEIINTVNEIADQSKLLALNASIEAARAGEEGKGFAVVAMEVRQLAEQSREATARVGDILNEIQQATNTAVMVTEEGSKGADGGMQLVEEAGAAIRELSSTIEGAAQASNQIAASTRQQTNGMEQLASAMAHIKQATTQAAASTRQAERSAQNLAELAGDLEAAVARYQI